MECREVLARFSDYLDGGLGEAERGEFAEHVAACQRCGTYRRVLTEGIESYRSLPEPDLSDDFYLRLQHRLFHVREKSRLKSRGRTLVRTVAPTMSASVVFLFAVFLFSSHIRRPDAPSGAAAGPERAVVEDGITKAQAGSSMRSVRVQGGLREMNERFIRNNIWKVLLERRSGSGYVGSPGEIVPLQVSSAPERLLPRGEGTPYRPLGVTVVPVLFQLEGDETPESRRGLRILEVEEMSPALSAGIRTGDIIVGLDHIPVTDAGDLTRLVQAFAFQTKTLQIYREGRLVEIPIGL
jgi:hypothetical protein